METIINPVTGRRVLKNGVIGRKIQAGKIPSKKASRKKASKKSAIMKAPNVKTSSVITETMQNLCFSLEIETTKTAPQRGMLLNRFEEPDSKIKSITIGQVSYYDKDVEDCVPYTIAALKKIPGFKSDTMTFKNGWIEKNKMVDMSVMTFNKKGGFSCWDVIQNIVKFDKLDRSKSKWFGGVDCHHIFYEGLALRKDGTVFVRWGS